MKEFFFDKSFTQAEIDNLFLSGNEFENCLFDGCILSNLSFEKTIFIDCTFSQCDLNNVSLKSAALKGVTFNTCKLNGIHFEFCPSFMLEMKLSATGSKVGPKGGYRILYHRWSAAC